MFDQVPKEKWGELYQAEYEEYQRQRQNYGKFYARLPLGESPYDVAIRIHQFMGTIHRDYEKHGIDTLFVFTHGTALTACDIDDSIYYTGYGYLAPYISENGNYCRYVDDEIVEIGVDIDTNN